MRKYSARSIMIMVKAFKRDGVLDYLKSRGLSEDVKYLQKNYFKNE